MSTATTASIEPLRRHQQNGERNTLGAEPGWKTLYRVGGVVSLLMALFIPIQLVVFTMAPPQSTAAEWFVLYQRNAVLGLLGFELLMVVYAILSILLALALAAALWQTSQSLTAIYLVLSIVGSILFIAARPTFDMLSLSQAYSTATTDAQRALYLAAGEAKIATFNGTSFQVSYILGSLSGLVLSVIMLRSKVFGNATAWLRILSSVFDFGLFIPVVGIYVSIFSVLFLWIFHMLAAYKLLQLVRLKEATI
jgi:hypothetical protein